MEKKAYKLYTIIPGKTGSKYIVVAQSEELSVAVRIISNSVSFHIYEHGTFTEKMKNYLGKLGFVSNTNYWTVRFMVNNKLHKLIVIGGVLYALTDIVEWVTMWPDAKMVFEAMP